MAREDIHTNEAQQYEKTKENEFQTSANSMLGVPLLSFFSGAGFLDIGFMQAGFDIIWRNEYNRAFVKGFEYAMAHMPGFNNESKVHNTSSVAFLNANQIAKEAFHNLPRPDVFGVIGGPPCPDFSIGGRNRGREGDRGKLSQIYVDLILELQPTFFLFENVPGLLRTQKHRQFLYELINRLNKDYLIDFNMLNALDYRAPQDRERLFLLGFLKKWVRRNRDDYFTFEQQNWEVSLLSIKRYQDHIHIPQKGWFSWPPSHYENAKMRYNWPAQSPFGSDPEKPLDIPDELMIGSFVSSLDELAKLPNGLEKFEPRSNKFTSIAEGDVSGKSFKRLHRWRYSPAAAYGNNEVHLHPIEARRLTVREALRIQTVPEMYIFPPDMPLSHKFKMIGNGVPVTLAQAVAEAFSSFLISNEYQTHGKN